MNQVEFQDGISRLAQCFGERNYPAERTRRIWEVCGRYPHGVFAEAVGRCIDRMRVAPFREDLNDVCRAICDEWRSNGRLGGSRALPEPARWWGPWRADVTALMHMIRDGNTERGFKFALRYLGLTEEGAWQLYEEFASGNFNSEKARKMLAALKPTRNVVGVLVENRGQTPRQNGPISNDVGAQAALDSLFGVEAATEGKNAV